MLAEFDAKTRFQVLAARGKEQIETGMALLEKATSRAESAENQDK